jgi:hypothetical protein
MASAFDSIFIGQTGIKNKINSDLSTIYANNQTSFTISMSVAILDGRWQASLDAQPDFFMNGEAEANAHA